MLPIVSLKSLNLKLAGHAAAALAGLAMLAGPAAAQADYPTRPIALIIPFAAGGSTDLVGRVIAAKMSEELGQQVVVENRGGAGGNLGAAAVAKAEPDGYTILMATVATHALNPALYQNMPYDPVTSFEPISLLVTVPNVLTVNPSFGPKTVQELIDKLKAEPGKHSYASSGNGTPLHLSGELFKSLAGVDVIHVPYKGSGPALVDVVGGQVPMQFDNLPSSTEYIKTGRLIGLAVTGKQRSDQFPDIPTLDEAGVKGYETYTWNALFAPAKTPKEIVAKLNAAANKAIADPAVKEQLAKFSAATVGSTPEELGEHVKAELAKWAPIVKASGAKID